MRYWHTDNEMYNRTAMDRTLDWEARQRRLYNKGKEALGGNVKGLTTQQVITKGANAELEEGVNCETINNRRS